MQTVLSVSSWNGVPWPPLTNTQHTLLAALRHGDDVPGRDLGGPVRATVPCDGAEAGVFRQVSPAREGPPFSRLPLFVHGSGGCISVSTCSESIGYF